LPRPRFAPALLAFALAVAAGAASAEPRPDRWQPVTPEELALHDSVIEPGTDVEALFVKVWTDDSYTSYLESARDYYLRLKIYTDAGAQKYSTIDIDYPLHGVRLSDVRARVVQPDGSTAELGKKAVTERVAMKVGREGVRRASFALPGVRAGSVIEYRYRLTWSDDQAWILVCDFQFEYPARLVTYHLNPIEMPGLYTRQLAFHTVAHNSDGRVDGYYESTALDLRAYRAEPDSPPEYQVRGWVVFYYTTEALESPDVYWRKYARSEWEWVDPFTRPDGAVSQLATNVCVGVTGDLERVHALSDWMRDNFRVAGSASPESLRAAGLSKNGDARAALRQRGGTAFDAVLALVALARGAGLEARLARVPERSELFFDQNMMSDRFLRSYDAAIRVGGTWTCFDACGRYLPWDMLNWAEEAQPALLCDRDSSRFVSTAMAEPERSRMVRRGELTLHDDGTLEGDIATTYSGHLNGAYRALFEDIPGSAVDSTYVNELGWNVGGVEVSDVALDRGAHDWDPLVVRCHLRLREHATVAGKRMILEPANVHAHVSTRFTSGTRRSPVYFRYAWTELDSVGIRLPEGWSVEAVDSPEPVRADSVAEYRAQNLVSDDRRSIVHLRWLVIGEQGSTYFPTQSYAGVKKLFDMIHERDRATITLVRTEGKP